MESLSGKQVKDIKDLYQSIYKVEESNKEENLDEYINSLTEEEKKNIFQRAFDKFMKGPDYKKKKENVNIKPDEKKMSNIPPEEGSNKKLNPDFGMINKQIVNDKGEVVGSKKVNPKVDPSAKETPFKIQQKDVIKDTSMKNEVKPEVKNEVKPEVKNEVKPEVKSEIKPVKSKMNPKVKKEEKPIIINLPNGGTKKIYPASDEYKKIKSGELTTSKSNSSMVPDVTNIKKNEKGEISGELKKPTTSVMGKDVKEIEKQTKKDNEVKKKVKPLLSTKLPDTTKLGSTIKPVKPGSARDKMIAKNEIKLGTDRISNLRNKNADFQAMKKGDITKMDFMKQYPNSQTTKKYNLKQIKLGKPIIKSHYEPYDLVLDYVLSEGHAETVEEAHYVMTQMDADTIQGIVEMKGGSPYIINQADVNASTEAFKNFQKGMKNKITGEDLYKLAPGVKLPKV